MREYSFDLHLHSCLSPCGSDDNTPANLAGMCALAGLDIVALTDHNTTGNCAAFCAAAERYGLLALPGMELTTLEEAHIICLFPDLACASAFDAIVHHRLPPMVNDPAVFGPQVLMDADDRVLGEETALLAGATGIGVYEVADLVRSFGGTAFPAHIDRPSFSVLSNLGLWDPAMAFPWRKYPKIVLRTYLTARICQEYGTSLPATPIIWIKFLTHTSIWPCRSARLKRCWHGWLVNFLTKLGILCHFHSLAQQNLLALF